ncbi:terminase small subunit [Solidesulfovibrio sp.]
MQEQQRRLTDRQQRFVEEYLVDCNAAAAAARAGYSPNSARHVRGLAPVRQAIEAAMAERSRRVGINQDRVVLELARLAFADMRDFVAWGDGGARLRPSDELTEDQAACVSEIVETPGKGVRVKLHGKTQALAALSRHLGGRTGAGEASGEALASRPVTVVTWIPHPGPPGDPAAAAAAEGPPQGSG